MRHHMMMSSAAATTVESYFEQDVSQTLGNWYGPEELVTGTTDDLAAGIDGSGVYVECIRAPSQSGAVYGRVGVIINASGSKPFSVGDVFNVAGSLSWRDETKYNYRTPIRQLVTGFWMDTVQSSDDPTSITIQGNYTAAFTFDRAFLFNSNNIYPAYGSFDQDITVPSTYDKGLLIYVYYGTYEDAEDTVVGPVGTLIDDFSITVVSRA